MFLRLANVAAVLPSALFWLLLQSFLCVGLVYYREESLGLSTKSFWSWIEGSKRKRSPWGARDTDVPARLSPPPLDWRPILASCLLLRFFLSCSSPQNLHNLYVFLSIL